MSGGWTRSLAEWSRNGDGGFAADMEDMRETAGSIFGALKRSERADRHRVIAGALQSPPLYPAAGLMLAASRGLAFLDLDEAEILLALWRADRAAS